MNERFTAEVVREGKWFMATCREVPEANGQGKSRRSCLADLAKAVELVRQYRRETPR